MAQVKVDVIEGAQISEGEGGFEVTRTYIVSGLTGNPAAILHRAMQASGVPLRGDPHPDVPGVICDTRSASPAANSKTAAIVTCQYREVAGTSIVGGPPEVSISTTLGSRQTSRDIYGRQMIVVHNVPEYDDSGNLIDVREEQQVVTVSIPHPMTTVIYRRKETRNPISVATVFTGTVGTFGDGLTGGDFRWLCQRIEGFTQDGGKTFDTSFEFQYNRLGWNAEVEPIDPGSGQPYIGGTPVQFETLPRANWSTLQLPSPVALGQNLG